jgi:3-(3-hydroxy-phenyl)propionate hydroxylase
VADDEQAAHAAIDRMRSRPWPLRARIVVVLPAGHDSRKLRELPGTVVVHDADTDLRARYASSPGTWWLLRPDGHIAACSRDPDDFADLLRLCSGAPPSSPQHVEMRRNVA